MSNSGDRAKNRAVAARFCYWISEMKESRRKSRHCGAIDEFSPSAASSAAAWIPVAAKLPYQVKVKLVIPKVTDVPKAVLKKLGVDAAVGRFDNCLHEDTADDLVQSLLGKAT